MIKFKTIINISLILGLTLPSFCLAQSVQEGTIDMPQTMEEAKGFSMDILKALPDAVKKVWQEEAWPFILNMWEWVQGPWNTYVKPKVEVWWQQFLGLVGKEQPDLKKEFQAEREEMQKDFWERFKDLF